MSVTGLAQPDKHDPVPAAVMVLDLIRRLNTLKTPVFRKIPGYAPVKLTYNSPIGWQ
jgi:hypothetical protein